MVVHAVYVTQYDVVVHGVYVCGAWCVCYPYDMVMHGMYVGFMLISMIWW